MIKWGLRIVGGTLVLGAILAVWLWSIFQTPEPPRPMTDTFRLNNVVIINPMINRSDPVDLLVSEGVVRIEPITQEAAGLSEYDGMFVLPGFIDMHSHLPNDSILKLTQHYGLLHLAHGVTTVRDAGDLDGTAVPAARDLIAKGAPFPRLVSCGPFVSHKVTVWPNTIRIDTTNEATQAVETIAAQGHDCIKAYEGLTPDLIRAVVNAAEERGMHVIGHVPADLTLEEAGVPDVQHFFGVPEPDTLGGDSVTFRNGDWSGVDNDRLDDIVFFVTENRVRNTPTLMTLHHFLGFLEYEAASAESRKLMPAIFADVVWNPETGLPVYRDIPEARLFAARDALSKKQTLAKRLSDADAILHLGTDAGQPFTAPGASYWIEMRLFEEAGISPEQVLAYATNVAANSLGTDSGRVADGAPADLLIFKADPTTSLDALSSLQAVVLNGQLYTKAQLNAAIERSLSHYAAWPLNVISKSAAQRTVDETAKNF